MMGAAELARHLDEQSAPPRPVSGAAVSVFRLETLQAYEVAADGTDFRRYLDGATTWTVSRKQPWIDRLVADRAAGICRSRVRLVTRPITSYTRFECEWGYAPNVEAGEDVRILDLAEQVLPDVGVLATFDWWLVTDRLGIDRVTVMEYDAAGQFVGATARPDGSAADFGAARSLLWAAAEPFGAWWSRHPELHRCPAG